VKGAREQIIEKGHVRWERVREGLALEKVNEK